MTYIPSETRYETMSYRRCGRSGLLLPAISLGLWHNFGNITPFSTQQEILRRFVPLLKPDGLLFAGHSENFSHLERRFTLRGQTVYALSKD